MRPLFGEIGQWLGPSKARNSRERGSARGQMQEGAAGKFHEGSLANSQGMSGSLCLDVGRPDHLAPLLGFVGDKLAEVGG